MSAAAAIGIDWHGHRDRDFAVDQLAGGARGGATRLHGAAIGIGERVGNTPMDMLLVNLVLMGYIERDLSALGRVLRDGVGGDRRADSAELSGRRTRRVPHRHRRARRGGDQGVSQAGPGAGRRGLFGGAGRMVGREQEIEVGPMSGRSNVIFWLEKRGLAASDALVDAVFARAKASASVLTEEEILEALEQRS